MDRQGVDLAHQLTHGGVDLLVALDAIESGELLADDHRLVVGLLATAMHVALVEHLKVRRGQGGQLLFDALLHVHRGVTHFLAGALPAFGSSSWSCRQAAC